MHWVVLAIVGFVALYTFVSVQFRREAAPTLPYEYAQVRGAHALREVGWEPFPNAYGQPAESDEIARAPYPLQEIAVERISRREPGVAAWADHLPPLEQGEQIARLLAPETIAPGAPYIARILWDEPEEFRPPQLLVFRQDNRVLIVPRPPDFFPRGSTGQTVFIIPPEFLTIGNYEIFLSTEGYVNRWTFEVR